MTNIPPPDLIEKVFLMGAMIGELRQAGLSEKDIRRGVEAALIQAKLNLGEK
jgi:hypothetical protein